MARMSAIAWHRMGSPFVYEEPVGRDDLVGRDEPAGTLLGRLLDGRNSRLEAPRRFGKTSLLLRVLDDTRNDELVPVYVNFLGVLTPGDVADRIERAYREQLDSRLRRWFTGLTDTLQPTLGTPRGLPVSARIQPRAPEAGLLDRLAVPRRLHDKHGRRCAIVFDEFQDVLRAGDQLDAVIRSELEQHGQAAAYVFSGSHPGMMRELFGSRRRGFYAQAGVVELGPLARGELAAYIGDRFEAHGRDVGDGLAPLLDLADGHPQRSMLLAHHLFEHTAPRGNADSDSWQEGLASASREIDAEIQASWRGLTATRERLVAAIADGGAGLASEQTRTRFGLPKTGSHRGALEALEGDGQIVRADSRSGWRLVDPMFALWLRNGRSWTRPS